ncbi:MAG: tyrosine-type recombinase/integrase [Thermoproteota archaeon]
MLKETGARASEAFALKWTDVDFEAKTVRITLSKGGEPRLLRISHKLLEMLNSLPKTSERIFGHYKNLKQLRKTFERQRRRIAHKLNNLRLKQIHFHTIRHWKATMERDILHVMKVLGYKNIKNSFVA